MIKKKKLISEYEKTIFFFFSILVRTLKYANMIRISNISFFRFCWKNRKLDWPKCARTAKHVNQSSFCHGGG